MKELKENSMTASFSINDTLDKVSKLPKQIEDVTSNIAKAGYSVDKMMTKLGNAIHQTGNGRIRRLGDAVRKWGEDVAGNLEAFGDAVKKAQASLADLENCRDVLTTSSLLVNAVIDSCSGHFHARATEQALSSFDNRWDSWAKAVNGVYEKLSPTGQSNILEKLAREAFGDNVFSLGSAVKNESAGVLGGIADFEDALHAFRGSYRDPVVAVKKIETGVKGIVNATERVAGSINNMIKTWQQGTGRDSVGNPVLSYISGLHDTKAMTALNKTLSLGGGVASLWSDGGLLSEAVKSKDLRTIYGAGKKTYEDARATWKALKDVKRHMDKKTDDKGGKQTDEKLRQVDAQVAALICHYTYFYLDWLEYDGTYKFDPVGKSKSKNLNQFSEEDLEAYMSKRKKADDKNTDDSINMSDYKRVEDVLPTEQKVLYRIISRIQEVFKFTRPYFGEKEENKMDTPQKLKQVILDILDYSMKNHRAVGFYEFYSRCKYWKYLEETLGKEQVQELISECENWLVCNPECVYEKNKRDHPDLFQEGKDEECKPYSYIKVGTETVCYTSLLKTGLGIRISGFGSLLFVKNPEGTPNSYIYCTKGTDVNSLNDWILVDVLQAFTGFSMQHLETVGKAIKIDETIRKHNPNAQLIYVGHSLGGGLASANAIVSPRRHAITFNAASLNFIGVMLNRTIGVSRILWPSKDISLKDKLEALRPLKIAERVHPIRIKGELIDVLQIVGRFITLGLLERGYGKEPLIIDLDSKGTARKHGISNFLHSSILRQVRIVEKRTREKATPPVSQLLMEQKGGKFTFEKQDERLSFNDLEKGRNGGKNDKEKCC